MNDSNFQKPVTGKDWYELGYNLLRAGDLPGALNAFRRSIKINPKKAPPWIGLARVLDKNGQFVESRECLKHAVAAEPSHVEAHLQLAIAHKSLGHVEDSKREYEHTLSLDPKTKQAHFGLGHLMEEMGDPEEAAESYRAALDLDPMYPEPLANLLGLGRHTDVSAEIEMADQFMENADARGRSLVGYGLGKAYAEQKSYDQAFDAYSRANAARIEAEGTFDSDVLDQRIEAMLGIFDTAFYKERRDWGNPTEQPVFIVGLPRSGTTLTEQIIGSHPDCFGAGELQALTDVATSAPDRLGDASLSWPLCAPNLTAAHVDGIAKDYLAQSNVRAPASTCRVVDKQPLNFWHLGLVAMTFPNAKIIHCTRDIRDCGLSIFTQNFSAQQFWSTDLDAIVHYWRGYKKLMAHWEAVTDLQVLEVSYEETVSDLEGQARRLLDFLELSWDERVLNFHENDRAVQTPSKWQVRQPLYQSSKERWRRYEKHLGPLINAAESP